VNRSFRFDVVTIDYSLIAANITLAPSDRRLNRQIDRRSIIRSFVLNYPATHHEYGSIVKRNLAYALPNVRRFPLEPFAATDNRISCSLHPHHSIRPQCFESDQETLNTIAYRTVSGGLDDRYFNAVTVHLLRQLVRRNLTDTCSSVIERSPSICLFALLSLVARLVLATFPLIDDFSVFQHTHPKATVSHTHNSE
jgi:hypothetical protein